MDGAVLTMRGVQMRRSDESALSFITDWTLKTTRYRYAYQVRLKAILSHNGMFFDNVNVAFCF